MKIITQRRKKTIIMKYRKNAINTEYSTEGVSNAFFEQFKCMNGMKLEAPKLN